MKKALPFFVFFLLASLVSCKQKSDNLSVNINLSSRENPSLIVLDESEVSGDIDIHLTGKKSGGGLKIISNGKDSVNIYLEKVTLSSSDYPCIEIKKGSPVNFYFSGKNFLTDGRHYGSDYGKKDENGESSGSSVKGTIYSKGSITFSEKSKGSVLNINENYLHCISSKKDIVINSGTLNLNSTGRDGINAGTSFVMNGGILNISGTGENQNNQSRGIIVNGTDSAKNGYDGNGFIKINDGNININTYGKAISAKWKAGEDESKSQEKVTVDPSVYIYGGKINISTYGKVIEKKSWNTATFTNSKGKEVTEIIKSVPEGIEAKKNVCIYGGDIKIRTTDDGINSSVTGNSINIYGGNLDINSSKGDGLDSNGNILIEGGNIVLIAEMRMEHALDCGEGYKITINGGNVFGISGSDFIEGDWSDSKQMYINFKNLRKNENPPPPPEGFDMNGQAGFKDGERMPPPPFDGDRLRPGDFNFADGKNPPSMDKSMAKDMDKQPFEMDGNGGPFNPDNESSKNVIVLDKDKISSIEIYSETFKVLASCKTLTESFGFVTISTPELSEYDSEKSTIKINSTIK